MTIFDGVFNDPYLEIDSGLHGLSETPLKVIPSTELIRNFEALPMVSSTSIVNDIIVPKVNNSAVQPR